MKYSKFIFILFFVIGVSCTGELDIEPRQSISEGIATATAENIKNILIGAYNFGRNDLYGGNQTLYVELLGNTDQTAWNGTFANLRDLFAKQMTAANGSANNMYADSYFIIGSVNTVLANLDKFTDDAERNTAEGEALFIRGLAHFELVRLFGLPYAAGGANSQLGVPVLLLPPDVDRKVPRNTVSEVYSQVVADLTEAYTKLPDDNGVFADKYAAQAVLARVYLQMGDYANARDAANDVIANSGHGLMPTFADVFGTDDNTNEHIFSWIINNQEGTNFTVNHYASQPLGGRGGDISVEQAYLDKFDSPLDERASFFYDENGLTLTSKYARQFANTTPIRLAEMYLIRAEANFREGTSTGATPLADINAVRSRSSAPDLGAVTLDLILNERELELAFEGFVLHDYKRTQRNIGGLPYDDNRLVMPIPQSARDRNDLLEQNPGYAN
ncbi:RagB/SusD family nutrient uptake outer membrane protein [Fulvivirgaceae bacterium BMA10]|uniref:RagB/SusD family nutrient uptake outer membrane protein n=1 Tax=Splendidivirga corallicola TaxID=3051826 RepID=A0ABT8KQL2_9BACT|nr:RagB/SusD family nutrient uptake outer membrane protein [Fulvivirgaceae bacterium BMA10]